MISQGTIFSPACEDQQKLSWLSSTHEASSIHGDLVCLQFFLIIFFWRIYVPSLTIESYTHCHKFSHTCSSSIIVQSSTQNMTKVSRNTLFLHIGFTNFHFFILLVFIFLLVFFLFARWVWRSKIRRRPIILHHCIRIARDKQRCETFNEQICVCQRYLCNIWSMHRQKWLEIQIKYWCWIPSCW